MSLDNRPYEATHTGPQLNNTRGMMMSKYTEVDLNDVLYKDLRQYEATVGRLTPNERKELREWVAAGNDVHCNPYLLYGENGHPLDFITAGRIAEDMRCNPDDYSWGPDPGTCVGSEDESLPF